MKARSGVNCVSRPGSSSSRCGPSRTVGARIVAYRAAFDIIILLRGRAACGWCDGQWSNIRLGQHFPSSISSNHVCRAPNFGHDSGAPSAVAVDTDRGNPWNTLERIRCPTLG